MNIEKTEYWNVAGNNTKNLKLPHTSIKGCQDYKYLESIISHEGNLNNLLLCLRRINDIKCFQKSFISDNKHGLWKCQMVFSTKRTDLFSKLQSMVYFLCEEDVWMNKYLNVLYRYFWLCMVLTQIRLK